MSWTKSSDKKKNQNRILAFALLALLLVGAFMFTR